MKVVLFPMHNYYVGDDDREYLYSLKSKLNTENIVLISNDYTPKEAISIFKYALFTVGMRFHSVVFSISCNTPCIAIDYHYGKGKVSGFMSELNLEQYVIDIDEFTDTNIDCLLSKVKNMKTDWFIVNNIINNKNNGMEKFFKFR